MKKLISLLLAAVILVSVFAPSALSAESSNSSLCKTLDFLMYFNTYVAIIGTEHTLTTETVEISSFSDSTLFKAVFNNCEILSLILNQESEEVMEIHCTYSTLVPGSTLYTDDFIYLLMESLMACGLDYSNVSDLLYDMGIRNKFEIGDSGESIIEGISIGYTVTSTFGISYVIKKAK